MRPARALAAALSLASAPLAAQDTIPLAPYGDGALRQVAVAVAGDTFAFLFDTGAGVTVISPAVAARIGCTPSGRSHGYRMTGEHLEGPVCRDVPLALGTWATRTEASVMDIMALLGPNAPVVHGMISLRTFEGQALTLDLQAQQLVRETPATLAARVAGMRPVPVRLATGLEGGMLDAYIGVPAGDAELWLLWDSGNQGPTWLAPWAAAALGVADAPQGEHAIRLGDADVVIPVAVKDIIHDGVLNARLVERAVWSIDLRHGRLWIGDVAPLLSVPPSVADTVVPPARDPNGWYELTLIVNGGPQRAILHVQDAGAVLRFVGEERVFTLRDVHARGDELSFLLPMRSPYPVRLEFAGLGGTGTWGGAGRGGAASALKVR